MKKGRANCSQPFKATPFAKDLLRCLPPQSPAGNTQAEHAEQCRAGDGNRLYALCNIEIQARLSN